MDVIAQLEQLKTELEGYMTEANQLRVVEAAVARDRYLDLWGRIDAIVEELNKVPA